MHEEWHETTAACGWCDLAEAQASLERLYRRYRAVVRLLHRFQSLGSKPGPEVVELGSRKGIEDTPAPGVPRLVRGPGSESPPDFHVKHARGFTAPKSLISTYYIEGEEVTREEFHQALTALEK